MTEEYNCISYHTLSISCLTILCADIVSVLDIDWASLAKEAAPKQTTGSLVKRFHPATIFSEIGISRSLAGPALFDKVKALCEEGVKVPG